MQKAHFVASCMIDTKAVTFSHLSCRCSEISFCEPVSSSISLWQDEERSTVGTVVVEIIRYAMEFLGAYDQVEIGKAVDKAFAPVLSHTAHDPEDESRVFSFPGRHITGFANGLLFCLVADAAGIEQNDVGLVFMVHDGIASLLKLEGNGFGIPLVHLTAVRLDEYRFIGRQGQRTLFVVNREPVPGLTVIDQWMP